MYLEDLKPLPWPNSVAEVAVLLGQVGMTGDPRSSEIDTGHVLCPNVFDFFAVLAVA